MDMDIELSFFSVFSRTKYEIYQLQWSSTDFPGNVQHHYTKKDIQY